MTAPIVPPKPRQLAQLDKEARAGGKGRKVPYKLGIASTGLLAALLIFWQVAVVATGTSSAVMPTPLATWDAFVTLATNGMFIEHGWVTLQEIILGFVIGVILGVVLGALIAEFATFRFLVYPYIVVLQTIPKVALAPLFLIWFGFGIGSKVLLAVSMTFFPVVVNTIQGIMSSDQQHLQMLRAYGAKRWDVFKRVKFPSALPAIFSGMEIAIVLAVIAAVISEFVGATKGLGYLVMYFNTRLDTASEFAALAVLSLMGFTLNALVKAARTKIVFWDGQ